MDVRRRGHRCGCCLVVNTDHRASIGFNREITQPRSDYHPAGWRLLVAIVLAGWAATGAAGTSCTSALGPAAVTEGPLKTLGTEPATAGLGPVPGDAHPLQVDARGHAVV